MTGLDPINDVLLQICCYITDCNLQPLDYTGFEVVIHRPRRILDNMGEWCTRTHASTGLTSRCLESTTTISDAGEQLLEYIKEYVPEKGVALLAGNSVHADKVFLVKECPQVIEWLHYRILDVSTIKEAARRWAGEQWLEGVPEKKLTHEARQDILESIEEMKYWKGLLFDGRQSGGG